MSLVVDQLTRSFPTRGGTLNVLRGVALSMNAGESVAVMGPSGSGKSTLLQIIGTLDQPTSGTVTLDGVNPFQLRETELAAFRNRKIGFVFQDHHLLPQCTVLENVLVPTLVTAGLDRAETEQAAKKLLEQVGLANRLDHRPAELSGGERQRVAIARALILKPPLLLADEPTGNLDRKTARDVGELLMALHHAMKTILIVVTHSADLAATFPKRAEMNDGLLEWIS
ncbi:ABC transporter ATP-binding protein [Zavarzinella formosa]|uniref:ABC transporter ATP-binding protein n=1 Tax=Zavarzinella formosa TaxID=360055 RepID=UPI000303166B|nr:ABC transporter ATP-binding protein [Zavarzinella formosa]